MQHWPDDNHISNVAHNGECDAPTYKLKGLLYRENPVNNYALVWTGRKWIENQRYSNQYVKENGDVI